MKKRLSILIVLNAINFFVKGQCTSTIIPTVVFGTPGSYAVGSGQSNPIQICSNVVVYDTLGGSTQKKYYLMPGAALYLKNTFSHFVYMQGNSTLTKLGSGGGTTFVYYEASATTTGSFTPAPVTCSAVSFPTVSCSGVTGINKSEPREFINIYPNPATDKLFVNAEDDDSIQLELLTITGVSLQTTMFEKGKPLEVSHLQPGFYFLIIRKQGIKVLSKQLLISN